MSNYGMLLVTSEPPATMEDEFNDWYNQEHIPERLGIKGFLSAVRYISTTRPRSYLALYDLVAVDVLQSPGYRAFAGENFTPWTRRVVSRSRFRRYEAVQESPGNAATIMAPRLLVYRFANVKPEMAPFIEAGARRCLSGRKDVLQWRIFSGSGTYFLIVSGMGDLMSLVPAEAFLSAAACLELTESYLPC